MTARPDQHGEVILSDTSSHVAEHTHPITKPPEGRCSACRWSEVQISKRIHSGEYVVRTTGRSTVEGEVDHTNVDATKSAQWVVDSLIRPGAAGTVFLPRVARRALAEAAAVDDGIAGAYSDRAVL